MPSFYTVNSRPEAASGPLINRFFNTGGAALQSGLRTCIWTQLPWAIIMAQVCFSEKISAITVLADNALLRASEKNKSY